MIKINSNEKVPASVCPEEFHQSKKPVENNTFGAILEKCIVTANRIDERKKKTPQIGGLSPIGAKAFQTGKNIVTVEHAERMLNTLNEYQRKLASPGVTLREISPLINEIEKDKELLALSMNSLFEEDELKNILNQLLIISSVEIIKFNRGDYVNP